MDKMTTLKNMQDIYGRYPGMELYVQQLEAQLAELEKELEAQRTCYTYEQIEEIKKLKASARREGEVIGFEAGRENILFIPMNSGLPRTRTFKYKDYADYQKRKGEK